MLSVVYVQIFVSECLFRLQCGEWIGWRDASGRKDARKPFAVILRKITMNQTGRQGWETENGADKMVVNVQLCD